jgi:hypothetical protein
MAIIKAVNSGSSLGGAIDYITKKEKTEEKLIATKDCSIETVKLEMQMTKEQFHKTTGRQYKHYIQSFNPEDKVTPEQAYKIGSKFMDNEKFKGHEVVMATHKDKDHVHNHFIVNSVNFENGKKYHEKKTDLQQLKEFNNELCHEYNLTVPVKGEHITSCNMKKYKALEKGIKGTEKSYLIKTARDVSSTLKTSNDREQFIKNMEQKGYQVRWEESRKNITFTTPEGKKVRSSNLEKTFKQEMFNKGGMELEMARCRELRTGTTKSDERQRTTVETHKRNERTQPNNAELHQSTHGQGHDKASDTRKRIDENNNEQSRDSKQNGIDTEGARRKANELRKSTSSDFGKWKKRDDPKQPNNTGENDRDREHDSKSNEWNSKGHEKPTRKSRDKDFGHDR